MDTVQRKGLPWHVLLPLIVTAAAIWANVGGFWWGSDPKWWNVLATAVYLLCWCVMYVCCRGAGAGRMVLAFGIGTALSGLVSLGVVAGNLSWLTLPALLLAPVFAAPLYGLDSLLAGDNTVFWLGVFVLGVAWTVAGRLRQRKKNKK